MGAGREVPAPRNVGGEAAEPEQWQEEEQGVAQRGGADGEGQEQGEVADEVVFESTLSPQGTQWDLQYIQHYGVIVIQR